MKRMILLFILFVSITHSVSAQKLYRESDINFAIIALDEDDFNWTNHIYDKELKLAIRAAITNDDSYLSDVHILSLKAAVEKKIKENDSEDLDYYLKHGDWYYLDESTSYSKRRGIFDYYTDRTLEYQRRFNIRAGAWLPIGNLKNAFKTSLHLGLRYGMPIFNNKNYIDLGGAVVFPKANEPFEFYNGTTRESFSGKDIDDYYTTKVYFLWDISIWYRYQQMLKDNIYLNRYIGIGYDAMILDKKKYDGRLETGCLSFKGGLDVSYRAIGVFVELNYTFYQMQSELPNDFGSFAIIVGLNVRI